MSKGIWAFIKVIVTLRLILKVLRPLIAMASDSNSTTGAFYAMPLTKECLTLFATSCLGTFLGARHCLGWFLVSRHNYYGWFLWSLLPSYLGAALLAALSVTARFVVSLLIHSVVYAVVRLTL